MRLRTLRLIAFGAFTGRDLELAAEPGRLEILHGPNEAGKTTALRAIRYALYGIPVQNADDFLHPYARMRIGACIARADGVSLEFVRRKAVKNPLRAADDETVLDDGALAPFLDRVELDFFRTMFAIDHESLIQGGKDILEGKGNLGQILFQAGAGLSQLKEVQTQLDTEIGDLYKPSGKQQVINRTLRELADARKEIAAASLDTEKYERCRRELEEAQSRRDALKEELEAESRELARLERLGRALPMIARWKGLSAELAPLASVIVIPDNLVQKCQESRQVISLEEGHRVKAARELASIETGLENLEVPPGLLENEAIIADLFQEAGAQRKAQSDRRELIARRQSTEHEVKEKLRSLGREPDLEKIEDLRVTDPTRATLKDLATKEGSLRTGLEKSRSTLDRHQARVIKVTEELEALPPPRDIGDLAIHVEGWRAYLPLEEVHAELAAKLVTSNRKVDQGIRALGLWKGDAEGLAEAPFPTAESADRHEQTTRDTERTLEALEARLQEEVAAIEDAQRELDALALEGEVPTEADLTALRAERDLRWDDIRAAWLGASGGAPATPPGELAADFERLIGEADQVADRLRREAERVARKAERTADRDRRTLARERLTTEIAQSRATRDEQDRAWAALWAPVGITPLGPAEMRAWLRRKEELLVEIRQRLEIGDQVSAYERQLSGAREEMTERLEASGALDGHAPGSRREASISALLSRAQHAVKEHESACQQRQRLETERARLEDEVSTARHDTRVAGEQIEQWHRSWTRAMTELRMPEDSTPTAVLTMVEGFDSALAKWSAADVLRRRLKGLDGDAEDFAQRVGQFTAAFAPDLSGTDPGPAVAELHARLVKARDLQKERIALQDRRERERATIQAAEERLLESRTLLDAVCGDTGCAGHDELPEALRRSGEKARLLKAVGEARERILDVSGGASLESFITEAEALDADSLATRCADRRRRIDELAIERQKLDETVGARSTDLKQMGGESVAAERAEKAAGFVARLESAVRHYASLKLADSLLRRAIERYRERTQGPLVSRAGELFRELTGGSFDRLVAEYDEKGDPVLRGRRPGEGGDVGVTGMSDGTRDQLYLALRIASFETYLRDHEPMPFIVDDILLNFDDQRAAAALRILADLAKKTQVLFFTHHRHHLELARQTLPGDRIWVQDL